MIVFLIASFAATLDGKYPDDFITNNDLGESTNTFRPYPNVKITINAPSPQAFHVENPIYLIFFATPNGNTVEQTAGKKMQAGDDWHVDIQHIAAQTRFLRKVTPDNNWIIIYLENQYKSWPRWNKETEKAPQKIEIIFDTIRTIFSNYQYQLYLSGHSGGGSLIFYWLAAQEKIHNLVQRITFLDSN